MNIPQPSTPELYTKRRSHVLLRSAWQTVNIGDIAHTPGVLALLEKWAPDIDVTLWPCDITNGVEPMLRARFPAVRIVTDPADVRTAFDQCDFLLHGSGPSLVAQRDVEQWLQATGKPYGVMGITLPDADLMGKTPEQFQHTINILSAARFVYFRDSRSLALARAAGCAAPVMDFGPDGAFACDLRDDARAEAFLQRHALEPGRFLCCIPRLRYTPYWTIPAKNRPIDPVKHAHNEEWKEHDHAPLRQAIKAVVAETDLKVLLCPEDQTQMAVGREMIWERLSPALRERVAWREDFWLTNEAASTYARSAGLFGHEMHSPILCIGQGVPAIVCRWAEQTSKGFMWQDIGLADWLFDFDRADDPARLPETVLAMALHPDAARAKAARAHTLVAERQAATVQQLLHALA